MDCRTAQDEILESFIEPRSAGVQAMVDAHVADCAACTVWAERQRAIDRDLAQSLVPRSISARFRAEVRERVRQQRRPFWSDLLPDAVHFASCGLVTMLGLIWLPLSAPVVLAIGAAGALLTHVVLTAAHDSLDAAEETAL
jgi:hypothetical protein